MQNWKRIVGLLLCLSLVLMLIGCKKEDAAEESEPVEETSAQLADKKLKSASEAAEYLADFGKDCGYENALLELTEKSTTTIDGESFYRLQQNYQGIPVYKRAIVYVVDENGESLALTGNARDIADGINLVPTISIDQAVESIKTYLAVELGIENADVEFEELDEDDLCIYNMGEDGEDHLAYQLNVGSYEFVLDAHSGKILCSSQIMQGLTGYAASDQNQERGFPVEINENGQYVLEDLERRILIYDLNRVSSNSFDNLKYKSSPLVSDDLIFGNSPGEENYENSVSFYFNLAGIHDYLSLMCNYQCEWVFGFINDGYDGGMNAFGGRFGEMDGEFVGKIIVGYVTGGNDIDVLAHEYTHVMSREIVDWSGETVETSAINEAISDIFGELYEAYYNNWDSPDWVITGDNINLSRNIHTPSEANYADHVSDSSVLSKWTKGQEYYYSTVISHAAYLMWNGVDGNENWKISSEELAKLWYRAMLMMPSDCDFSECRTIVELAADIMDFSQDQMQCIREAFDEVGIYDGTEVDFELHSDATLCVYGENSELCDNYIMQIAGTRTVLKEGVELEENFRQMNNLSRLFVEEKYYEIRDITTAEAIPFALDAGTYQITLIDNQGSGSSVSFKVRIGAHDGKDNLDLYTDFGSGILPEENHTSFAEVIESVQDRIGYSLFSDAQKEYCRGEFFDMDGSKALILLYASPGQGYYVGLWIENTDHTISCVTDQMLDNTTNTDNANVTSAIRLIDGKCYLNTSVRLVSADLDVWQNLYYLIDEELVLAYNLYSESPIISWEGGILQHDESKSFYMINSELVDCTTFYSTQDELNKRNMVVSIVPSWSEGLPPQGQTFEELLMQIANESKIESGESTGCEAYISVVQEFMSKCGYASLSEYKQQNCKGLLYDLNQDGQEELLLQYMGMDGYSLTYEIWTIENGDAICLLDAPDYSGNSSAISIVEYSGSWCFVLSSWIGGSGGVYSQWLFYDISSIPYQKIYDLGEETVYDGSATSYYINDKSVSQSKFNEIYSCLTSETEIPLDTNGSMLPQLIEELGSDSVSP